MIVFFFFFFFFFFGDDLFIAIFEAVVLCDFDELYVFRISEHCYLSNVIRYSLQATRCHVHKIHTQK